MSDLKPSARISGGQPNGLPNYKPINKLPDNEIRELLKKTLRPALYQVNVDDIKLGHIPVGPKCSHEVANAFAHAITQQIKLGREQTWSNPTVCLVI